MIKAIETPKQPCAISVVIIAYNAAGTIEKPIGSILKQQVYDPSKDVQLIIVDDQSTDDLKNVVYKYADKFADFKYVVIDDEGRHKLGALRYAGAKEATGTWATYLDADDTFLDDTFQTFSDALKLEAFGDDVIAVWGHEYYKPYSLGDDAPLADNYSNGHLHGKFYLTSFMNEAGVEFAKDMTFEEDLYYNTTLIQLSHYHGKRILEITNPMYLYEGSPSSICRKMQEQSIKDGILYPDHHLEHFDDFIRAAIGKSLELYEETHDEFYFINILNTSLVFYWSINHYYFLKRQFKEITIGYTEYLNAAKMAIVRLYRSLPAGMGPDVMEQFAYDYPDTFLNSKGEMMNAYKPGGYVYNVFPVLSLHEYLVEFFMWS